MTKDMKMEMMMMIMMMIWMIKTDQHHAPSITMTWSWYHVICVLFWNIFEQYFTFSPSILFFSKHSGCKFKGLKHIRLGQEATIFQNLFQLNTTGLLLPLSQHSSPAKFFKWLAYISDRYVLPVWVGFLDKKKFPKNRYKT